MLQPEDVGQRVVVRRIVGIRAGRPCFSDALGELAELNESHLTLITAQGRLEVPRAEIHRARRVPPSRRPAAAAVAALEHAADAAWPAPNRAQLGDWLLRSADGWTGRANSALPVGDPDRPLPAAIDAVQRWYADLGRPAMINTPLPLAAPVSAELDARGWSSGSPVLVQTVSLAALPPARPDISDAPPVELTAAPSADWLAVAANRKGDLPAAARHVLTAVPQIRFAQVRVDGRLVATGRGTVTGTGRWLGLSLIEVAPEARRQGLARRVVRALAQWGTAVGATNAFLQVERGNAEAVPLYRALGFTTHHTYRTRTAPAD
ncbi:GNAT family N-acetyltransferase [Salinispora cortesiana]|uniref:GNAT family N-acetyltransferase n=1 Tax=Salinispora cortesiana TaxID=1305843 RepID=UPI0004182118|nr:GNAT family N-acetyltransferase [Salinispora cortesiana]